jgi:hypothetical protein
MRGIFRFALLVLWYIIFDNTNSHWKGNSAPCHVRSKPWSLSLYLTYHPWCVNVIDIFNSAPRNVRSHDHCLYTSYDPWCVNVIDIFNSAPRHVRSKPWSLSLYHIMDDMWGIKTMIMAYFVHGREWSWKYQSHSQRARKNIYSINFEVTTTGCRRT